MTVIPWAACSSHRCFLQEPEVSGYVWRCHSVQISHGYDFLLHLIVFWFALVVNGSTSPLLFCWVYKMIEWKEESEYSELFRELIQHALISGSFSEGHGIQELPIPWNHTVDSWVYNTWLLALGVCLADFSFVALNLNQIYDNDPSILGNKQSEGMNVKMKVWCEICLCYMYVKDRL